MLSLVSSLKSSTLRPHIQTVTMPSWVFPPNFHKEPITFLLHGHHGGQVPFMPRLCYLESLLTALSAPTLPSFCLKSVLHALTWTLHSQAETQNPALGPCLLLLLHLDPLSCPSLLAWSHINLTASSTSPFHPPDDDSSDGISWRSFPWGPPI